VPLNTRQLTDLYRIEEIIDALESRGSTSSSFYNLCSELQTLLDAFPFKSTELLVKDDDVKKRIGFIVNRLRKIESFASAQSEITSGLQKYIANPDK
jgi:hypothetical protein